MFSPPPLDWIEECRKEWAEKQREKELSSSTGKSNAEANTSSDDHETKYDTERVLTRDRVCFYDDGEAPPREHIQPKKPPESGTHVAFF